jgi:hypothetical protein
MVSKVRTHGRLAAQFSVFSMVDDGGDGYPLQYQQAKTPVLAGAGASPAGYAAPAEEDPTEWMSTLQIAKRPRCLERIDVQTMSPSSWGF